LLLFVVVCCCLLLFVVVCCCLLFNVCCCLVLFVVVCCFDLLLFVCLFVCLFCLFVVCCLFVWFVVLEHHTKIRNCIRQKKGKLLREMALLLTVNARYFPPKEDHDIGISLSADEAGRVEVVVDRLD